MKFNQKLAIAALGVTLIFASIEANRNSVASGTDQTKTQQCSVCSLGGLGVLCLSSLFLKSRKNKNQPQLNVKDKSLQLGQHEIG
ncbi:hypothetical protein F7734_20220 [Scytonema sp. UIC 10036]|uniref:hypothetical protein n=1 Tax=Scytonema sp. UIC 10036 TaxID=2304196 RepID=UPI0012DA822D|nr:hypothetical protein [Scytonema sp. UIC 10036]MUG94575.1 hypothetical protein [Scytonema sp. UIC 10036]